MQFSHVHFLNSDLGLEQSVLLGNMNLTSVSYYKRSTQRCSPSLGLWGFHWNPTPEGLIQLWLGFPRILQLRKCLSIITPHVDCWEQKTLHFSHVIQAVKKQYHHFPKDSENTRESGVDTAVPKFSVCLLWLSSRCWCGSMCLENKRGRCPHFKMQMMTKLISV